MGGFKIEKDEKKMSSINRTIRFSPETFEELMELSEESKVSFNKVVNQCVEYALRNLDKLEQK